MELHVCWWSLYPVGIPLHNPYWCWRCSHNQHIVGDWDKLQCLSGQCKGIPCSFSHYLCSTSVPHCWSVSRNIKLKGKPILFLLMLPNPLPCHFVIYLYITIKCKQFCAAPFICSNSQIFFNFILNIGKFGENLQFSTFYVRKGWFVRFSLPYLI